MKCLDSLTLERDHRAAMVFKKCSVNLYVENNCLSEYQQLLTPYSFSYLVKQFELCSKVKITESARVDENSYKTTIHLKGKTFLTSSVIVYFLQQRNSHASTFLHYVNMLI